MIKVSRSTTVGTVELWELISDLESWASTLPTVQRITRVGDAPIAPGGRFEVRQPGLPKAVYEITHWEPGRAFTWVSQAIGIRTTASHRLEPESSGTRLVLTVEWSGPLAWLARLLVASKTRRMVELEAESFVRLAEHAERSR